MQAVILAAGLGKRLRDLTKDCTKCMVEIGGVTLIERMLRQLEASGHFDQIVLVTGYKAEVLTEFVNGLKLSIPITFVNNKDYEKTNNIYSLYLACEGLEAKDTLVLESDIIFEDAVLDKMLAVDSATVPCMTFVAKPEPWMDGSVVKLDDQGMITEFINTRTFDMSNINDYYKTVSIYRFSGEFLNRVYRPFLKAYVNTWGDSAVYESALKVVALQEHPIIQAEVLKHERWYEINDIQDVDIAESIFTEGPAKVTRYLRRFGGYWRYPTMYDFCYLVNPFFPTDRFMNEMKANFETLIREYPSGMAVNSLLAGKYFDLLPEYICVGNGTAELIKSLIEWLSEGGLGMIYPTFEEYPHRKKDAHIVPFYVKDRDFDYTVDDIMAYYEELEVRAIVLVNPDNPSGHFIRKPDILRLADWCAQRDRLLIVDESFIDFAKDEEWHTLLENGVLEAHKNLIVLKSISKSFGVAGLRLGVLATSDTELIKYMKKDVAIWNINSFAEYYMQIIGKYRDDYHDAMERFKEVRDRYLEKLNAIKALKVYPSQANYVMCYIKNDGTAPHMTSGELATVLLNRYNILIKDLSTKEGCGGDNYIRLSIKTDEENDALILALTEIFRN